MVMHARKTQRISDGYFEKHQAHPYQSSKYSSSKSGSYPNTSERYERMRDSPNSMYRQTDSPDTQSPRDRDRSYSNKSTYLQKIREKERERENRDYKSSREKYSDCVRSPKDKRLRESEHRTNHDRSDDIEKLSHSGKMSQNSSSSSSRDRKTLHNSHEKRDERERITRVGDWSEHISSSGKKYYYNCKTEVSQWEKPREWLERIGATNTSSSSSSRLQSVSKEHSRSTNNNDQQTTYQNKSSSFHNIDKHSRSSSNMSGTNTSNNNYSRDKLGALTLGSSVVNSNISSNSNKGTTPVHRSASLDEHQSRHHDSQITSANSTTTSSDMRRRSSDPGNEDMDISPSGDSTPTLSEGVHNSAMCTPTGGGGNAIDSILSSPSINAPQHATNSTTGPILLATALPRIASLTSPQNSSGLNNTNHQMSSPQITSPQQQNCTGGNILAGTTLPKLLSQKDQQQTLSSDLEHLNNTTNCSSMLRNNQQQPDLMTTSSNNSLINNCSSNSSSNIINVTTTTTTSTITSAINNTIAASALSAQTQLKIDINVAQQTTQQPEGPPTPTHSEVLDNSNIDRKLSSPPSTLSSLGALRPQGPSLTPSLAKYFRDDLVNHVRSWPAEGLEKQAQKLSEDAHILGSIQCSKVSADLKIARSLVRLTEIQATLQEQRILFLRQQIKMLEELKSQNSFMSDDS